jgi:CRP/FNR family cyclic AMP-dependent transcriptional regulator
VEESRLREIPLFARLSANDLRDVARNTDEVEVTQGRRLIDEGRSAYEFFLIEEGTAEVVRGGEHVAELGPGDFFGDMGLLSPERRRNASVVATSPMQVVVMTAPNFRRVARDKPHVAREISRAVVQRARALAFA